jgi:hypothetical protein
LQQIRDSLTFFLVTTSPIGYDATIEQIKCLLDRVGRQSIKILNIFKLYVAGDENSVGFVASLREMNMSIHRMSHSPPPPLNNTSSSPLFPSLFCLFHDLALLRSVRFIEDHVGSDLVILYAASLDHLIVVLETCHDLIFGENGFISSIFHLTWSETMSAEAAKIHDFLKICYSVGANDHVNRKLSDLPAKMVSGIQNAISHHLSLIDEFLTKQQYDDIFISLKVITLVELNDESFHSFRLNFIEEAILFVQESVKKVYIQVSHALRLLVEKDSIESSEYQIVAKVMMYLREACTFNFTPCKSDDSDHPSQWLMTLVSISRRDWSYRVSQFYDALSGNDFPRLSQIFLRLDSMEPLWDFLSEMDEDTSNLRCAIDNFLENPQNSVAEMSDQLHCDCLFKLSSHFSTSLILRRHLSDALGDWSNRQKVSLLDLTDSLIKEAIQNKDASSLHNELNLLHQHRFGTNLHASTLYDDACKYVRSELLSLSNCAKCAFSGGDLEASNTIRLFLEDSTVIESHLEGLDLQAIIASLLSGNRQSLEQIPGEVLPLLEKRKFQILASKLRIVRKSDFNIYQECDSFITHYFSTLSNSLDFSSLEFLTSMELYSDHLSIFQDSLVLSAEVSYEFRIPILKLVSLLDRQFSRIVNQILNDLKNYKFDLASQLFDQLANFHSLDSRLLEIKDSLRTKTNIKIFQPQIDHFTKRFVRSLPDTLINECRSLLTPVSPLAEIVDYSINLSSLNRLVKSVSVASTSGEVLFQRLVNFPLIKKQLLDIFVFQFQESLSHIKLLISRSQLELAEKLISLSHLFFVPCFLELDLSRHFEATRLLKDQQQALHSATNFISRPQITNLSVENIDEISSQLRSLRSNRFDLFSDLYHQYSALLREEML